MKALSEEEFALLQALSTQPKLRAFAEQALPAARVTRERTGVGFFATFVFDQALPSTEEAQWDWTFEHPAMPNGGSFICWREDPNTLGVEGVSHEGDWPKDFCPGDFREME